MDRESAVRPRSPASGSERDTPKGAKGKHKGKSKDKGKGKTKGKKGKS